MRLHLCRYPPKEAGSDHVWTPWLQLIESPHLEVQTDQLSWTQDAVYNSFEWSSHDGTWVAQSSPLGVQTFPSGHSASAPSKWLRSLHPPGNIRSRPLVNQQEGVQEIAAGTVVWHACMHESRICMYPVSMYYITGKCICVQKIWMWVLYIQAEIQQAPEPFDLYWITKDRVQGSWRIGKTRTILPESCPILAVWPPATVGGPILVPGPVVPVDTQPKETIAVTEKLAHRKLRWNATRHRKAISGENAPSSTSNHIQPRIKENSTLLILVHYHP